MKTKHILTAIALPSLLVACNNEEFENIEFTQPQSERPLLSENFVLKVTSEGEGAESRYAVEGDQSLTSKFETGDLLGAAIIDKYKTGEDDPSKWDIIESIAGNIPFKYNAETSIWSASSRLGVGHYLYTFPYNPEDNNRGAASYSLPTVQELYNDVDGVVDLNAAVEKGNKAVYSDLVTEDDLSLNASLKNLYSYPKFVVSFDNGQPVTTVSQVVLEYTGNDGKGFEVKGRFNHEAVYNLFHPAANAEATDWDDIQTAAFLRTDEDYGSIDHSKYIIAKLPNNAKVQTNSLTNNKTIEVRFMMPGALTEKGDNVYGGSNLNMYVYTNNGVYEYKKVYDNIVFKQTTTSEQKERVFARNASYTLTLNNLTADNKDKETPYIVTDVQSWNKLVSDYGASANSVSVAVVGDNFTLNADAKMPSKATFTITTPVKIEGNVTIKNVTVDNTVTVEKGATLTTSSTFAAIKVENNGTLNIAVALNDDSEIVNYGKITTIENNGTLNIVEEAEATFALTNKKGAVVENNGTIKVSGTNNGTINNNATINTIGFKNEARETKEVDGETVVVNEPTINVAKGAKILADSEDLTNKSLIVNEGVVTCKNVSGTITNATDGVIDSKAGALTYITDNNGKVIVYSANTANLTIGSTKGTVEYETVNASESFKNSLVNTVIASKDLTVTEGKLTSLTFTKNAKLTLGKDVKVSAIHIKGGTTTLASNLSVETLSIVKGAMIVVPENISLIVTGNEMDNKGTILVGGTFKAENIIASEGGLVEDNGKGSIIWDKAQGEKDYEAAVKELVNAWILHCYDLNDKYANWSFIENLSNGQFNAKTNPSGSYSSTTWLALTTEATNKYNAWKDTKLTTEEFEEKVIKATGSKFSSMIAEYEAYGNSKRGEAIAKNDLTKDWNWLVSANERTVYVQATKDTKFEDIVDGSTNKMVNDFATKVNSITTVDISTSTQIIREVENTAIVLSLKAVTGDDVKNNPSWVPAYSYVRTYEGAEEFEVLTILNKYKVTSTQQSKWNGNITEDKLKTIGGVKEAMTALIDAYYDGNMSASEKLQLGISEETLNEYATNVITKWQFGNKQIEAVYDSVNK